MSNSLVETVVLGFSRTRPDAQYYVAELRGNVPVAQFPPTGEARVGDWLTEVEVAALGLVSHLIVRPYKLETE